MRADALESLQDALRNARDCTVRGDGAAEFRLHWVDDAAVIARMCRQPGVEYSRVVRDVALVNYKRLRVIADLLQASVVQGDVALRLAQVFERGVDHHSNAAGDDHRARERRHVPALVE